MKNFIIENKEVFIFIVAGLVVGIGLLIKNIIFNNDKKYKESSANNNTTINNSVVINSVDGANKANDSIVRNNIQSLKMCLNILFVDDERFNIIKILKKAGWKNVDYKKNIVNIEDSAIIKADIIFVDINGVASDLFHNQGLGLAEKIKDKYPEKKVVIYSAENQGNIFDPAIRKVDDCLQKNAEPIEFSNVIENLFGDNE